MKSWSIPAPSVRRTLAACGIGGVTAAALVIPSAGAAPNPCTAQGLFTTSSSVFAATGQYLEAHPALNQTLTDVNSQSDDQAQATVRDYFSANPGEYLEMREIVRPLGDLQDQCNSSVGPSRVGKLIQGLLA
ncbi:heme-binding protein [Mycobacterium spongiae]|uniref:Hemophore-related protein n=1 Tax=Mycobacterium spongiae TaxID=886343 RepID=A0A975JXH5_9MYCO|nr:heme-binding protein [Mycobacterium spongiae]QUR67188.1 hemophore-related protein [Mycobacterium spongiae]